MLATAGDLPVDDADWGHEIKWDGVRAIAYVGPDGVRMESRNLLDISRRYPETHGPLVASGRSCVLDGEVVALDDTGRPSFQRLQRRMHVSDAGEIGRLRRDVPVTYFAFDVLEVDGTPVVDRTFVDRRALLDELDLGEGCVQVSRFHVGHGRALLDAAAAQGLEGVMAKRLTSTYTPGRRTRSWIKVKLQRRQELVVAGWLPGEGGRSGRIGALLVGYYDDAGRLVYAGRVGTGFTAAVLADLQTKLDRLARDDPPFAAPLPRPEARLARYVDPVLVAEVEFTEWTEGGTLRHPSYKGLRDDKAAAEVRRES